MTWKKTSVVGLAAYDTEPLQPWRMHPGRFTGKRCLLMAQCLNRRGLKPPPTGRFYSWG